MKFLKEIISEEVKLFTEAADSGEKKYYIEGCFMQGNIKNRNGRVYPTETLAKAVKTFNEKYVMTNRALGELNHPDSVQVNPERASHRIVSLWQEGDKIMGKALVLDTPMGKIVKALIDGGTQMGVSSRGFGSLKERNGSKEVQEDFTIAAVDIVSDPSAPEAFVNSIMEEKEFVLVGEEIMEVNEATEKAILEKHGCECQAVVNEQIDHAAAHEHKTTIHALAKKLDNSANAHTQLAHISQMEHALKKLRAHHEARAKAFGKRRVDETAILQVFEKLMEECGEVGYGTKKKKEMNEEIHLTALKHDGENVLIKTHSNRDDAVKYYNTFSGKEYHSVRLKSKDGKVNLIRRVDK